MKILMLAALLTTGFLADKCTATNTGQIHQTIPAR